MAEEDPRFESKSDVIRYCLRRGMEKDTQFQTM